nr:hypothetical protein [Tanacetum cinerariifolium]
MIDEEVARNLEAQMQSKLEEEERLARQKEEEVDLYSSLQSSKAKDKGKAKMIKPKKPLNWKDQIMIDEEVARNLEAQMQSKLEEEERLARQKEEEVDLCFYKL